MIIIVRTLSYMTKKKLQKQTHVCLNKNKKEKRSYLKLACLNLRMFENDVCRRFI